MNQHKATDFDYVRELLLKVANAKSFQIWFKSLIWILCYSPQKKWHKKLCTIAITETNKMPKTTRCEPKGRNIQTTIWRNKFPELNYWFFGSGTSVKTFPKRINNTHMQGHAEWMPRKSFHAFESLETKDSDKFCIDECFLFNLHLIDFAVFLLLWFMLCKYVKLRNENLLNLPYRNLCLWFLVL